MVGEAGLQGTFLKISRNVPEQRSCESIGTFLKSVPKKIKERSLTHLRSRRAILLSDPIQTTPCEKTPDFGAFSEFLSKCS